MKPLLIILLAQSVLGRIHPRARDASEASDGAVATAPTTPVDARPHAPVESEPTPAAGRPEPEIDWVLLAVRGVGLVVSVIILIAVLRRLFGRKHDAATAALAKKSGPLKVIRPPGVLGRREPPAVARPSEDASSDASRDTTEEGVVGDVPHETKCAPPHAQEPEGGWDHTVKVGEPIGETPAARAATAAEMHLAAVWDQVHTALGHDRTQIEFHKGLGVWRAWADAPTFEQAVFKGDSRTKLGAVRVLRIVTGGVARPAREFATTACRPSSRQDLGDVWTAWAVNRRGGAAHAYQTPPSKAAARVR